MATFNKQISQPGKRLASTVGGEQRVWLNITPERQQNWVDQFYAMKKKGLKVPAPFVHRDDKAGRPLSQEELNKLSSKDNAGWWEDFWVDPNTKHLMGRLEVPLPEDAARVGQTIQDVSPMFLPHHIDGEGHLWDKESVMHVALVTHPADKDQTNFQSVLEEEGAQMSLGFQLLPLGAQMANDLTTPPTTNLADVPPQVPSAVTQATPVVGTDFSSAVIILQKLGLQLPPDTNAENLIERIVSTGGQKLADLEQANKGTESTTVPPEGAASQPTPVALSEQHKQLMTLATRTQQEGLVQRIHGLIQTGRVSQDFATKNLLPLVNGFQLSLDQLGQPVVSPLETTLTALEAQPSPLTQITGNLPGVQGAQFALGPDGQYKVEEPSQDGFAKLEGDALEASVQAQMKNAGLEPVSGWAK